MWRKNKLRIGLITSETKGYVLCLLYYLIYNSRKPDFIIIVRSSLRGRIIRNFNLFTILNILKKVKQNLVHHTSDIRNDILGEFLKEKNISIRETSLIKACEKENISYMKVNDINNYMVIKHVKEKNIDILINANGGIMRSGIINSVKIGILNAHMGHLPEMRGMNVLEWSLFLSKEVGVTLHFIDKGIDTGDILLFEKIPIDKGNTIEDLRNKSGALNLELFVRGIEGLMNGIVVRRSQLKCEGKQYFVMHPRLKMIVEEKLKT